MQWYAHWVTLLGLDGCQFAQKTYIWPLLTLRTPFTASVYETQDQSAVVKKHSDNDRWILVHQSRGAFLLCSIYWTLKSPFNRKYLMLAFRKTYIGPYFPNQMIFWRIPYFLWWVHFERVGTDLTCVRGSPQALLHLLLQQSPGPYCPIVPLLITLGLWITLGLGWETPVLLFGLCTYIHDLLD